MVHQRYGELTRGLLFIQIEVCPSIGEAVGIDTRRLCFAGVTASRDSDFMTATLFGDGASRMFFFVEVVVAGLRVFKVLPCGTFLGSGIVMYGV